MLLAGLVTVVVGSFAVASGTASAHTGFESSIPADGATVGEPVTTVIVSFTNTAAPAGDGFVVLEPSGQTRTPSAVSVVEDRVFTLTFDPPLSGGTVGVRWSVAAPDAHPIDGAFSFVTPVPPPATTIAAAPVPEVATSAVPEQPPVATAAVGLEEFLSVDDSRPGQSLARSGRVLGYLALVVVLGLLAFLATTLVGPPHELRAAFAAVRILGVALIAGAAIEYVGVSRIGGAGLADTWTTLAGFSTVMRMAGGALLAVGFAPAFRWDPRATASLSSAVLDYPTDQLVRPTPHETATDAATTRAPRRDVRWTPDRGSWTIALAIAAILTSFWFDGHTVSRGPRALHAVLNSVHVAAGSIWAGGVISMAALLWSRHRRGRPLRAHALVVRFSGVATLALGAVAVAGVILAVFVLDGFGEITGTVWGRVLLLKTAAVAIASGIGAYNHFVLMPALDAAPGDAEVEARVRSSVTAEGIFLAFVVVVTASLVAAAS